MVLCFILCQIPPCKKHSCGIIYPRDISPKVNTIIRLKFELAYQEVADKHVNHYAFMSFLLLLQSFFRSIPRQVYIL